MHHYCYFYFIATSMMKWQFAQGAAPHHHATTPETGTIQTPVTLRSGEMMDEFQNKGINLNITEK